ncbi:unnamed protein product, partial [Polarella glacialis]
EASGRIKLIDFGLSRIWDAQDICGDMSRRCGTVNYMAPEVLETKYSHKADMWSLGVISFMLMSGKCPFYASSCDGFTKEVITANIKECSYEYEGEIWSDVSKEARDFVERLLVLDTSKRMDAKEALAHPWFLRSSSSDEDQSRTRRRARVDAKMLEGWRRFASFRPALR